MELKKSYIPILNLFRKDIFLAKTIRKISLLTKKDYPITYNSIKELERKKIINLKTVGNSKVCSLNLNYETISLFSLIDENESFSKEIPNIKKILDYKEFLDDIVLITGSYSKGKANLKSDIDLVIITKENVLKKQRLIENLTSLLIPRFHSIVISQRDFTDMLLDKKPNFGKEIYNNRLIYRNASRYYYLIKEAVENGFRS